MSNVLKILATYLFIPAAGWILLAAIALFVITAIFMATLNSTLDYVSQAVEKQIPKISYLQALAAVIFLYIVGVLLFKNIEPAQYLLTMTKSVQSTTIRAINE